MPGPAHGDDPPARPVERGRRVRLSPQAYQRQILLTHRHGPVVGRRPRPIARGTLPHDTQVRIRRVDRSASVSGRPGGVCSSTSPAPPSAGRSLDTAPPSALRDRSLLGPGAARTPGAARPAPTCSTGRSAPDEPQRWAPTRSTSGRPATATFAVDAALGCRRRAIADLPARGLTTSTCSTVQFLGSTMTLAGSGGRSKVTF